MSFFVWISSIYQIYDTLSSDTQPQTACDIADVYLSNELGSGWEWWHNVYEFHKLAIDELEAFDCEEYKKNGFKVNKLGDYDLTLDFDKKPE